MARLIIFANGKLPDLESARRLIQPGDLIYAANGGTRNALAMGVFPSVVIGDLDSLSQENRQLLNAHDTEILQYPRDKDKTDLELALDYAIQAGQREIIILGALGGRLDQTLGNLSLMSGERFSTCDLQIDDGVEKAIFIRSRGIIHGRLADTVSLIPWGGKVIGVSTEGLRWPLRNETLFPDKTRGISNEMSHETASISLKSGLLLVILHRQI